MADLHPKLPQGFDPKITLDTASPAYRAVHDAAKQAGMSQGDFTNILGMEARRAMERAGVAGAPVNQMSFAQKIVASDLMAKVARRR